VSYLCHFPITPVWSIINNSTNNVSGLSFQLLPSPLKFFLLFQLPLLLISQQLLLDLLVYVVLRSFNCKSLSPSCRNPSTIYVQSNSNSAILFAVRLVSLVHFSTDFLKLKIRLCQNILKIILRHLFIKVCRFIFILL
jgi:hypothetical protein